MRRSNSRAWKRWLLLASWGSLLVPNPMWPSGRDWPRFRGPEGNGLSAETGLSPSWPEGGPPVVWRRKVGTGFSGVAVAGDALYALFSDGERDFLARLRTADGEEVWRLAISDSFSDPLGTGPRATPTIDGDAVYGLSGTGRLVAVRAATGELLWEVDLYTEKYGVKRPQLAGKTGEGLQLPIYGYSASPLVEGELVVVDTGNGPGTSIVAFDKHTGEERWSALDNDIGYASPTAITLGDQRQILIMAQTEIVSLLPNGEVHWRHPWGLTVTQPVFLPPDRIFLSTSDVGVGLKNVGGAVLLRVTTVAGKPGLEVPCRQGEVAKDNRDRCRTRGEESFSLQLR